MPDTRHDPEIVTLEPATVAVLRETIPMTAMSDFFGRAFSGAAEALGRQGIAPAGPPLGIYYGMPTDTVDVAAGFPFVGTFADDGAVTAVTLPAGRAVQLMHQGSYDTLTDSYGRLMAWLAEQALTPGPVMWESYLTEPTPDGDQSEMLTLIVWPLAE